MEDLFYMDKALLEARKAFARGEVPVGAVIVKDGRIIARAFNMREELSDPTAHAELIAMREAAVKLGSWRLEGATLYVTLEPCPMCAGALVLARIERLVYGAKDPKAGFVESLGNLVQDERLNHRMEVTGGVMAEESAELLKRFFRSLR